MAQVRTTGTLEKRCVYLAKSRLSLQQSWRQKSFSMAASPKNVALLVLGVHIAAVMMAAPHHWKGRSVSYASFYVPTQNKRCCFQAECPGSFIYKPVCGASVLLGSGFLVGALHRDFIHSLYSLLLVDHRKLSCSVFIMCGKVCPPWTSYAS